MLFNSGEMFTADGEVSVRTRLCFCKNTLFTPTRFHAFTPGSCPVKPQPDSLTNEQLHCSTGSLLKATVMMMREERAGGFTLLTLIVLVWGLTL